MTVSHNREVNWWRTYKDAEGMDVSTMRNLIRMLTSERDNLNSIRAELTTDEQRAIWDAAFPHDVRVINETLTEIEAALTARLTPA